MAFSKQAYNKNQLLAALKKSLGVVSAACQMCNIERSTFYSYMDKDPEFKKQVEDLENYCIDFVETQFLKNIQNGNTAEILFYLKTKGRKRGYTEKQEIDLTSKGESIKQAPQIIVQNEEQKTALLNLIGNK
jgi:hypothetical protein